MKRFSIIMMAGLLIVAITVPALAWEYSMTGEAEYRFRYFARQGSEDIFGGPARYKCCRSSDGNQWAGRFVWPTPCWCRDLQPKERMRRSAIPAFGFFLKSVSTRL